MNFGPGARRAFTQAAAGLVLSLYATSALRGAAAAVGSLGAAAAPLLAGLLLGIALAPRLPLPGVAAALLLLPLALPYLPAPILPFLALPAGAALARVLPPAPTFPWAAGLASGALGAPALHASVLGAGGTLVLATLVLAFSRGRIPTAPLRADLPLLGAMLAVGLHALTAAFDRIFPLTIQVFAVPAASLAIGLALGSFAVRAFPSSPGALAAAAFAATLAWAAGTWWLAYAAQGEAGLAFCERLRADGVPARQVAAAFLVLAPLALSAGATTGAALRLVGPVFFWSSFASGGALATALVALFPLPPGPGLALAGGLAALAGAAGLRRRPVLAAGLALSAALPIASGVRLARALPAAPLLRPGAATRVGATLGSGSAFDVPLDEAPIEAFLPRLARHAPGTPDATLELALPAPDRPVQARFLPTPSGAPDRIVLLSGAALRSALSGVPADRRDRPLTEWRAGRTLPRSLGPFDPDPGPRRVLENLRRLRDLAAPPHTDALLLEALVEQSRVAARDGAREEALTAALRAAREALRTAPDRPVARAVLNRSAAAALEAGLYEAAHDAWEEAVRLAPGDAAFRLGIARALLRFQVPADALPHLETAVLLAPDLAPAWTLLAYARRAVGDAPGARAAAERATTLAPDDPLAQALLGERLVADGLLEEAEPALTAALRALPEDRGVIQALVQLGTAWQLRGDSRAALRVLDLVAGKAEEDAGWLLFSARAFRALGRHEEALARLEALVRLRPEYREAAFELAEVLTALGRRADARQVLDDAARRGLGDEELFRRLRELSR